MYDAAKKSLPKSYVICYVFQQGTKNNYTPGSLSFQCFTLPMDVLLTEIMRHIQYDRSQQLHKLTKSSQWKSIFPPVKKA
jgi:hypothetical protein